MFFWIAMHLQNLGEEEVSSTPCSTPQYHPIQLNHFDFFLPEACCLWNANLSLLQCLQWSGLAVISSATVIAFSTI